MEHHDILDLLEISNESLELQPVDLTAEQAIELGQTIASCEASMESSADAYDSLTRAEEAYSKLGEVLSSNESTEAAIDAATKGIDGVSRVLKIEHVVSASNESLSDFAQNLAGSAKVFLNKLAQTFKKWVAATGVAIISAMANTKGLVDKLIEAKKAGKATIMVDDAIAAAVLGVGVEGAWYKSPIGGDKDNSAVVKFMDKLTFSTNEIAKALDGDIDDALSVNLSFKGDYKRGIPAAIGNGMYAVLAWNSKGGLVTFKARTKDTTTSKRGEVKFKDLDISYERLAATLNMTASDVKNTGDKGAAQIEKIAAQIETLIGNEEDKAKQRELKDNIVAVSRFYSDAVIGNYRVLSNAIKVAKAIVVTS